MSVWFPNNYTEVYLIMKRTNDEEIVDLCTCSNTYHTWFNALLSCCCTLHAVFDTVVQLPTLVHTQINRNEMSSKYNTFIAH